MLVTLCIAMPIPENDGFTGAAGSAPGGNLQQGLMVVGASPRDPLNTWPPRAVPCRVRDWSARAVQRIARDDATGRARRCDWTLVSMRPLCTQIKHVQSIDIFSLIIIIKKKKLPLVIRVIR